MTFLPALCVNTAKIVVKGCSASCLHTVTEESVPLGTSEAKGSLVWHERVRFAIKPCVYFAASTSQCNILMVHLLKEFFKKLRITS